MASSDRPLAPLAGRLWQFAAVAAAALALGRGLGWLTLAGVFFLVLTPVGLLLRLMGRNPLRLHAASDPCSYWQVQAPTEDVASYLRPY
jgi:hypothetical protein